MTERKRARVITGWRQVTRPKGISKPRSTALPRGKAVPGPRVAVPDTAANESWETEGGHLSNPVK